MVLTREYDRAAKAIRSPCVGKIDGILDPYELVRHATLAASSHNSQPWKFRIRGDSIDILPDFSRRCPIVDPDDSHLFKSLGCAAENLVHAAAAQGFSSDVRFDPARETLLVRLDRDTSIRPTELYRAITRRQCVRAAYDGRSLEAQELKQLEDAGKGQGVRAILLVSESAKESVIGYVTQGNLAQLSDPAFREELLAWIRFNPAEALRTRDGLAGRTSNRPALPSWLARRIGGWVLSPKRQAQTDAVHIRSSAGVAVFVSTGDDKASWIETGRAYEHFALRATALDIRTAFVNQPIEVRRLRPQFESWLNLNGEHALLIVRFGHGPTAPFSLRRPIEQVMISGR